MGFLTGGLKKRHGWSEKAAWVFLTGEQKKAF